MRFAGLNRRGGIYFDICDNHLLQMYPVIKTRIIMGIQVYEIRKCGMNMYWWGRLWPRPKVSLCFRVHVINSEG